MYVCDTSTGEVHDLTVGKLPGLENSFAEEARCHLQTNLEISKCVRKQQSIADGTRYSREETIDQSSFRCHRSARKGRRISEMGTKQDKCKKRDKTGIQFTRSNQSTTSTVALRHRRLIVEYANVVAVQCRRCQKSRFARAAAANQRRSTP